ISLNERGNLWVTPSTRLTDGDREELRSHKAELLELLTRPASPPAEPEPEENIEMHNSALLTEEEPAEVCPVCGAGLKSDNGDRFLWTHCITNVRHFIECRIRTTTAERNVSAGEQKRGL